MMLRRHGAQRATAIGALFVVLTAVQGLSVVASADPNATIEASFTDSCRDFQAHSSKDISHVEIHYADARVVKDETIDSPDYSIDGGPGDEIASAIVKSGTSRETFTCTAANTPPTAVLEVLTPAECNFPQGTGGCDAFAPRTVWRDVEDVTFVCPQTTDPRCDGRVRFRGTSSSDPDDDIESWSIDFGFCCAPAAGSWDSSPPAEIDRTLGSAHVTLTVTDSASQSGSDTMFVQHGSFD